MRLLSTTANSFIRGALFAGATLFSEVGRRIAIRTLDPTKLTQNVSSVDLQAKLGIGFAVGAVILMSPALSLRVKGIFVAASPLLLIPNTYISDHSKEIFIVLAGAFAIHTLYQGYKWLTTKEEAGLYKHPEGVSEYEIEHKHDPGKGPTPGYLPSEMVDSSSISDRAFKEAAAFAASLSDK